MSRWTVRKLRRRWKPFKQEMLAAHPDHPTPVRLHRAMSWLARVEQLGSEAEVPPWEENTDLDVVLICEWIAFNSLYGQWQSEQREPAADRESWRRFLDRILALDADGRVADVLREHRRLVESLLDDAYLSRFFWQAPSKNRAKKSRKAKFDARGWYVEQRWSMILDRTIERVYLMRCQLVHGAATHGSRLNRTALRRCCAMLWHLLPAILLVMIDHGSDEDWGPLCYPPLRSR